MYRIFWVFALAATLANLVSAQEVSERSAPMATQGQVVLEALRGEAVAHSPAMRLTNQPRNPLAQPLPAGVSPAVLGAPCTER